MNIWIKRAAAAAGIVAVMAMPMSSLASDGTITFTGAVTASTCTVAVNGGGADATVTLPTVDTAALANTAGKTAAGGTFFNMAISACTMTETNVQIYFEAGANVDETTGGLINSGGTSNVEVKLYNASQASVVGTQITPGKSTVQPAALTSTGGTQWFYAGYSTDANGAASAGTVSTSVTYSLIYY